MWIKHKAKDGDTLNSIVKQYENKDPRAILKYPENKKIAADLKAGKPLAKGTVCWVLDPKGKVYICKSPKGDTVVLDEKQYKAHQKKVHQLMDGFLARQRTNIDYATGRHDVQRKINKEQWVVSWFADKLTSSNEPFVARGMAEGAYKNLTSVTKGRKYKDFAAAAALCEKYVCAYTRDVHSWVDGLIDGAKSNIKGLKFLKGLGEFCGTLAAVTIAAPATLGIAVVCNGVATAGVGFVYDNAENVSRGFHGLKMMSAEEMAKRAFVNAVTGGAGAFFAGCIIKAAKGPFLKLVSSNAFIKGTIERMSKSWSKGCKWGKLSQTILRRETQGLIKNGTMPKELVASLNRDGIMAQTFHKFFIRAGVGGFNKLYGTGEKIRAPIDKWMVSNPKALQGRDPKMTGQAAAAALVKGGAADAFMDDFFMKNSAAFAKILNEVLTEHAEQLTKKQQ